MIKKELGIRELIAIAIGGMVGGGIFTVLGIAVKMIGFLAPFAILLGGLLALIAAYSYIKLGVYYKDEGATYSFFRKTFKNSHLASAFIGWYTIFGYISTLALYAYTFSSYAIGGYTVACIEVLRKFTAIFIIWVFAFINLKGVKSMSEIEDIMVYTKLTILIAVSIGLILASDYSTVDLFYKSYRDFHKTNIFNIFVVSSITFVAYEGFQLVINAVNDMKNADTDIPKSIYISVAIVAFLYFFIALGTVETVNINLLSKYQEYALAYTAQHVLGNSFKIAVIAGAILATSSAINSTLYGSSHQMARIADDGYMPKFLTKRKGTMPTNAIISMSSVASLLIAIGGLKLILEFGSITFLFVSFLMAIANFKIRKQTGTPAFISTLSIMLLFFGVSSVFYYEYKTNLQQLQFIALVYIILTLTSFGYSKIKQFKVGNP